MKCSEMERYFEDWLEKAAPPAVEEHLRQCARCRELAEELSRTSAWLSVLSEEPGEPSPAFWARLRGRLEEADRGADFWTSLAGLSRRTVAVLTALALVLALWVLSRPEPPVTAFDAPQAYLDDSALPGPGGNGQLDRDQVVLTLVAQREAQR